jgi:hypothetical protein
MRKRLIVVVLMIFLSFVPAYAGHSVAGGSVYCTCEQAGCIEDFPGECFGHGTNQQSNSPSDDSAALGIVIVALMLWLRLRA